MDLKQRLKNLEERRGETSDQWMAKHHAAVEDASVGETIGRVREMAKDNHIPEKRTQQIVKAAIDDVAKEDVNVVDENTDTQFVDEHTHQAVDPLTRYLDGMGAAHSDHPAGHHEG